MPTRNDSSNNDMESQATNALGQLLGGSPIARFVAFIVVAAALFIGSRYLGIGTTSTSNTIDTGQPTGSTLAGSANNGNTAPQSNGFPSTSFMQTARQITFHGCPPAGDGGDPVLNQNKNRVDDGNYQPVAFDTVLNLKWPKETERKDHAQWSASAQQEVAKYEGLPLLVEGYLALARAEGPETPNCHSTDDIDFHIWFLGQPGDKNDRTRAVVIESTPRIRQNHPGWTIARLNKLATAGTKIRVSGWLMLDPEHPDQVGQTRGTIWEIHPVMQIEVLQNNKWVTLDQYQ